MLLHYRTGWSLLAGLLFTLTLTAQDVRGRVVDEAGAPVPYPTVYAPATAQGTLGADDGTFTLTTKKLAPSDTLTVSCLGYATQRLLVGEVTGTDTVRIVLPAAGLTLQTAEVTARRQRYRHKKLRLPGLLNATYSIVPGKSQARKEFGTILRTRGERYRIDSVGLKLRSVDADSVLVEANVYPLRFGQVGASLLQQRSVRMVRADRIDREITFSLAGQGLETDQDFVVAFRLLEVFGSGLGNLSMAAKAKDGFGLLRVVGGRWERSYFALAANAYVSTPRK